MAVGEARRWFDRSRSRTAAGSGRLIAPPALFLLLILLLLFSMLLNTNGCPEHSSFRWVGPAFVVTALPSDMGKWELKVAQFDRK